MLNEKYWNKREQGEEIHELSAQEALAEAIENDLLVEARQIIGQGKEAFVCWGKDKFGRSVAIKSYKLYRTTHRGVIHGTHRTSPYEVIKHFAKLEFYKNLYAYKAGLPVPLPYKWAGYSYSMELIGSEEGPAPLLSDMNKNSFDDPTEILEKCVDILHDMFQAQFVHGDFSEHNLLWHNEEMYVIDFLQSKRFALKDAVHRNSPLIPLTRAYRILRKDLNAILPYFSRLFRVTVNYEEVLEYILGDIKEKVDKELELISEVT
ncbi:MAG: phosphotransferase [Candidatus Heimdallarchaeota archaeon]|nr:phosphotransferase [Candidatus Heimdallarchaeota archaeon]